MADITSNLKLYYALNEGTGTSCADSSASGLTGTMSSAGWAAGKVGSYCADLSGSKSISVGTSNTLNFTGTALTIAAWIYPTSFSRYYRIIERGGTYPSVQFSLVVEQTTGKLWFDLNRSGLGSPCKSVTALSLNTWTHIAVVYDGSTTKMYLNGSQNQSLSYSGSITSFSGSQCYVGRGTGGTGDEWPGKLDEVRVYDRALASGDITALYNFAGATVRRGRSNRTGARSAA